MTSEIIIACTGRSRYFDLDAVRTASSPNTHARTAKGVDSRPNTGKNAPGDWRPDGFGSHKLVKAYDLEAGAPPLDHWWHEPDDPDTTIEPLEWDGNVTATWHTGDSLTVLRTLPDNSVDLILTSPPFLALRSYLPADDPNKPLEMGSEPTPGEFLDALLDVVVECRRVLAPHGSLCVELGDTYAGSNVVEGRGKFWNGYSGNVVADRMVKDGVTEARSTTGTGWPLPKSLCLIPETFRFALAYGRNPHTGRTIQPWRIRNVIRWCRPNPPVGALGDKMRPATSDIAIACMSGRRYFDLDAVRTPHAEHTLKYPRNAEHYSNDGYDVDTRHDGGRIESNGGNPAGAPPLDHWWHNPEDVFDQDAWLISTEPYAGSHYATWPRALCIKPILAMCPQKVCTICGKPSERIVEATYEPHGPRRDENKGVRGGAGAAGEHAQHMANGRATKNTETLGWSDCGHNNWRPGHVLDPFAGSGTTGVVATGHGRTFTGIDLDARNYDLARERIGMWLDHAETPTTVDVPTRGLL